jgi:hypothetical protein
MTRRPIAWFLGALIALSALGLAIVAGSHREDSPVGTLPPTADE